jgi:hypothetical protein
MQALEWLTGKWQGPAFLNGGVRKGSKQSQIQKIILV